MNVPQNNQLVSFSEHKSFNKNQVFNTVLAKKPELVSAGTSSFVITRLHLKEIEIMKTSFRNQVRNVIALDQFIRKRLPKAGSGLGGAEPALIGINNGEELSFRLLGSDEAFGVFTATLQRKSYYLYNHSRADLEAKQLKVSLNIVDMTALEQELSIIFENIKTSDYAITLLLKQPRKLWRQKIAG